METRTGGLEVSYTAHGVPTYRLELWHDVRFAPKSGPTVFADSGARSRPLTAEAV